MVFIILFFTVIELPALVMLGIWFVEQAVFSAVDLTNPTGGGGGVAYFAHIGGFVFGLLTIRLLATRRKAGTADHPSSTDPLRIVVFTIALVFITASAFSPSWTWSTTVSRQSGSSR